MQAVQQQLEGAQEWIELVERHAEHPTQLKQTKADICKFVLDKCVLEGGTFFHENSQLAMLPEYERLRKWPTMMRPQDYTLAHV